MKKETKEEIDFVFEQNPDLARIGTKKQYEKHLETIFPESKVKDIVYHRSSQKIETFDKSKTKEINGNRFYFSPINTGRYGKHITQALLNIKNLAVPQDDNFINDVNKKHPEYTKGKSKWFHLPAQIYKNADKYGYDGVRAYEGTHDDEYSVYHKSQIHVLGSKKDKKGFFKFVNSDKKDPLKEKKKNHSLEKIVSGIFVFSFLAGLFLSLSEIGLTGNVVGNFGAGNKLLGIVLIVVGVLGLFLYKKLKGKSGFKEGDELEAEAKKGEIKLGVRK